MESKIPIVIEGTKEINNLIIETLIAKLNIQLLSKLQVVELLRGNKHFQEIWLTYLNDNTSLTCLAHHPLLIGWILEYFIEQFSIVSVSTVYDWIFQRWFSHQKNQLEKAELLKDCELPASMCSNIISLKM